ncbi:hypothetical protein HDU96_008491 [Phlyctochytrium bullatum]|nr:hypothetical protein HDU96_008491 [Phlyctochytrium bullatum]
MVHLVAVIAALAVASTARAQSVSTILTSTPTCAQPCFAQVFSSSPQSICAATLEQQANLSKCVYGVCTPAEIDSFSNPQTITALSTACKTEFGTSPQGIDDPAAAAASASAAAASNTAPAPVNPSPGNVRPTSVVSSISIPATLDASGLTGAVSVPPAAATLSTTAGAGVKTAGATTVASNSASVAATTGGAAATAGGAAATTTKASAGHAQAPGTAQVVTTFIGMGAMFIASLYLVA